MVSTAHCHTALSKTLIPFSILSRRLGTVFISIHVQCLVRICFVGMVCSL